MMDKNVFLATFPIIGITIKSNVNLVLKDNIMILIKNNVYLVLKILSSIYLLINVLNK